jgi:hypothetical protein
MKSYSSKSFERKVLSSFFLVGVEDAVGGTVGGTVSPVKSILLWRIGGIVTATLNRDLAIKDIAG